MLGAARLWTRLSHRPIPTGIDLRRSISNGRNFVEDLMARDLVANVTR